jgi:uncharacterized membrane protein
MGGRFYRPALGDILRAKPMLAPAVAFYLIYAAAIVALAVMPNLPAGLSGRAALHGAILGVAAYATYNLSNLATLRSYSLPVTIVDTLWGGALTAAAALIAFKLAAAQSA